MAGKGIDRSTTYLQGVQEIDVGRSGEVWQEVKSIQSLRNVLVHLNGTLTGAGATSVGAYINRHEHLLRKDGTSIQIGEGYCMHVLGTFIRYFEHLNKELRRLAEDMKREGRR